MDIVTMGKMSDGMMLFNDYIEQIKALSERCRSLVITDDYTLNEGKSLVRDARAIEGLVEDKRKELTKPLLDEKKTIDGIAKLITSDLWEGVKDLRAQILKYEVAKEEVRREELRKVEEQKKKIEEELKQKELQPEEFSEAIDAIRVASLVESELQQGKSSSISKVWTYEVVDVNLIPRTYMKVDDAEIKAAIRVGIRDIPGIRIFQKDQLVIR